MFDTKISDYILDEKESKGWALQGTYVKKENYPDFYSICLAQKEASETVYWLELLRETDFLTQEQFDSVYTDAEELLKLLAASIITMKKKRNS